MHVVGSTDGHVLTITHDNEGRPMSKKEFSVKRFWRILHPSTPCFLHDLVELPNMGLCQPGVHSSITMIVSEQSVNE
jgi:hypothetical protein